MVRASSKVLSLGFHGLRNHPTSSDPPASSDLPSRTCAHAHPCTRASRGLEVHDIGGEDDLSPRRSGGEDPRKAQGKKIARISKYCMLHILRQNPCGSDMASMGRNLAPEKMVGGSNHLLRIYGWSPRVYNSSSLSFDCTDCAGEPDFAES